MLYPGKYENHYLVANELREIDKSYLNKKSEVYKIFMEIVANCGIYQKILLSSECFLEKDNILLPKLIEALSFFKIDIPIKIIFYCFNILNNILNFLFIHPKDEQYQPCGCGICYDE